MNPVTHVIVTHNPTRDEWVVPLTADAFHRVVGAIPAGGPSFDQVRRQIDIWNRAEGNFRLEFSYRPAV
ncbi:MAG: hypothetical protein ABI574_13240 [Burkholderiales bacterium]